MDPLLAIGAGSGLSWEEFGIAGVVIGALLGILGWKLRVDAKREDKDREARLKMDQAAAEARERREERQTEAIHRISLVLPNVAAGVEKLDTKVAEVADGVCTVETKVDRVQRDLDEITAVRDGRLRRVRGDGGG
jgi:hypothetical protein